MTRQELRVELEWFCGCGNNALAAATLLKLLRLHPLYENRSEFEAWITDRGIEYLLLYHLDYKELTDHGSHCGGAWLTEKGEAVRDALAREELTAFEELFPDKGGEYVGLEFRLPV